MNKKRPKPVFTRGTLGTEDVDRLVEMINIDSHDVSTSDPKKAAKKARQKQKKEEERLRIEAEEAEKLRREEMQRRLAEEQLERAMKSMKIGGKKKKKGSNNNSSNKVDAQQQTDSSISSTKTETMITGKKKKTFTSRGVSCCLIGDDQVTITAPWKSAYSGWESADRARESPVGMPSGYVFQPGMPAQAMGFGQMHYPHPNSVEQTYNIDALPHSVINAAPLIAREEKLGSVHRMTQGGRIVTTVSGPSNSNTSTTNTTSSSKKKKKKNKQNENNSSSPVHIVNASVGSSTDAQRANEVMNEWNGMGSESQNRASGGTVVDAPPKEAGAKPEMVTIRRHPHYSDTTVTISMKNRTGAEDILYTLCNGQVVKQDGEEEVVPEVEVSGKKKSKKKRNRKKDKAESTSQPREQVMPMQVTATLMPPVAPVPSHFVPNHYVPSAPSIQNFQETPAKPPASPPVVHSLSSNAEIDLSRLRLPPGITITKVEQSPSADGSTPSGNMVRICNTGYFEQPFSITPTHSAVPSSDLCSDAELTTTEIDESVKCSDIGDASAVSHSKACNCISNEVASCPVANDEHPVPSTWEYQTTLSQKNEKTGSAFLNLNETGIPLLTQTLVNPFQLPNVQQDSQRSLENRKARLSSLVYGGSSKSSKRKQPRPLNFGSIRDHSSETSDNTLETDGSIGASESNSSFQTHALSLQQSLLQSQGKVLTSGLTASAGDLQSHGENMTSGRANLGGNMPISFNFNANRNMTGNSNAVPCSDNNS